MPIDDTNLKEKAELLADQYRKKAQLFKTNVVLIPHGEDFRYRDDTEWKGQYENLKKLFNYINNATELNMNVRAV